MRIFLIMLTMGIGISAFSSSEKSCTSDIFDAGIWNPYLYLWTSGLRFGSGLDIPSGEIHFLRPILASPVLEISELRAIVTMDRSLRTEAQSQRLSQLKLIDLTEAHQWELVLYYSSQFQPAKYQELKDILETLSLIQWRIRNI